MKKLAGIIAVSVLAITAVIPFLMPKNAAAAACANVSSFGAVALEVPLLEHIQERMIWIRMQASNDSAMVRLEVNNQDCLDIGGSAEQSDSWQWYTQRSNDGRAVPYSFARHDNNKITVIGTQPGVRVDKVLITDSSCVPQDFGNNCQAANAELISAEDQDYAILPPPVSGPLQGKVKLSNTPEQNRQQIKEVVYRVAGQIVQQSPNGFLFDTIRVKNGTHTVYITTTLQDGTQIKEMTVIEVKNPENPLTSFLRWAKLNQQALKTGALLAAGLIVVAVIVRIAVARRKRRRVRLFHGL